MKPLTPAIRLAVILVFIDIALILNYLRDPYFILVGVFYLDSFMATVLVLALLFAAILIGYRILRRYTVFYLAKYFAYFFIANSIINLVLTVFVADDMAGFLQRIIGSDVLSGFILIQVFFLLINLLLLQALKSCHELLR